MKKYNIILTSTFIFVLISTNITMVLATGDLEWSDPTDDLRCFTEDQIREIDEDWEDDDPDQTAIKIREIWATGTKSATPDCIDMTKIELFYEPPSMRLVITVQGSFDDCSEVFILIWGNCTLGSGFAGVIVIGSETGSNETVGLYYFVNDNNVTSNGEADITQSSVEVEFPSSWWDSEDCSLNILTGAMTGTGDEERLCIDIFPNSYVGEFGTGGTADTTTNPITSLLNNIFSIITTFLLTNLPIILILIILIVIAIFIYHFATKNRGTKQTQTKLTRSKRKLTK